MSIYTSGPEVKYKYIHNKLRAFEETKLFTAPSVVLVVACRDWEELGKYLAAPLNLDVEIVWSVVVYYR